MSGFSCLRYVKTNCPTQRFLLRSVNDFLPFVPNGWQGDGFLRAFAGPDSMPIINHNKVTIRYELLYGDMQKYSRSACPPLS